MRKMKFIKIIFFSLDSLLLMLFFSQTVLAGPQSTNYEIKDYTFGAGGTGQGGISGASNYTIFGTAGEIDTGKLNGASLYSIGAGLTYTLKTNVPAAPTVTNPATNYDRLKIVIDNGGNASDATFAIAISTDNFASDTRYVQSDYTIGANPIFLTYTGGAGSGWGGSSGFWVTGLTNNTTYSVKVKARQGNFTESGYGSVASATTSYSSLTFSLDSNSINFSNLNSGNSYTDGSKTTVLTTSTNAYNGYTVYAKESQALTSNESATIANYSGTNNTPNTWSGTGFGYTTSDSNLGGSGGTGRFSGTKYAGFITSSNTPGDPVADDTGPVQSPAISNEQFTISYRVTGDNTTTAGRYSNTIIYTIVAGY